MNFDAADRIARALLYEGYLLYPYRASAVKNQRRWTFGCLFPPDFPQPDNSPEGSFALTECLLRGDSRTEIEVKARFLQIDNENEIVEREATTKPLHLAELIQNNHQNGFSFAPIRGAIDIAAQPVGDNIFKLCVQLRNLTPSTNSSERTREEALPYALISSHLLLGLAHGKFFSMQDSPATVRELAAACRNVRAWPVLVGDPERCDTMLAAPIILSDFPQVAAESPGDLFDATEMDEMLTLRIRTLTPDEKQEMAATDPRAEILLRRSEAMDERQLAELHGVWRSYGEPGCVSARSEQQINGSSAGINPGMRVRLRPKGNADVYDLALAGKTALVVSIEQDFEDRFYVSVALDDDPGQDYGIAGRPGHRFYFRPDEVEPLDDTRS